MSGIRIMKISGSSEFDRARKTTRHIHRQLASLCLRKGDKGPEVLLVTSSSGRWILPKGWPMDDKKDPEAALIEAWEEAGVRKGKAARKPVGAYQSVKQRNGRDEPCEVRVFAVKVAKTRKDYPEADERDRKWVSLGKASKAVDDKGLSRFLKDYAKSA